MYVFRFLFPAPRSPSKQTVLLKLMYNLPMNLSIFHYLNNLTGVHPWFDALTVFTAVWLGNVLILVSILFLFFHKDDRMEKHSFALFKQKGKEILLVFVSAMIAWAGAWILKHLVGSLRPFVALQNVHQLFPESGFAFPSGHATFFSALAAAMYMYHKKIGIMFGVGAILIGLARIIGGVHFPVDILGGYILGISVACIAYYFIRPLGKKLLKF